MPVMSECGRGSGKMAAPMELYCWIGAWGLPSVEPDSLAVLTYARFAGAPLKVHKISNPWRSPSGKKRTNKKERISYVHKRGEDDPGTLPALKTSDNGVVCQTHKIIAHLRKQKYNADYDLSATQGADTLAFVSLLEEKLLPAHKPFERIRKAIIRPEEPLIHTFWVDSKNYVEHTRKWYADVIPFPLNFVLPNQMHKRHLERLQTLRGDRWIEDEEELEKELYREAQECMTHLSQRLGTQKFFFGDAPASLDAHVFSYLAPLLKAHLPSNKLQQHLKSLDNLCNYCTSILSIYFTWDGDGPQAPLKSPSGDSADSEEEPHKRRTQVLSVMVGLVAMIGYALLSGIVSIQRVSEGDNGRHAITMEDDDEEED